MVTNMKNTIHGFKRLLGRKFSDPFVQKEIQFLPFKVVQQAGGSIGIKANYLGEEQVFSPEQITAMLFTKLKDTAETALKTKVNDCVISVPSFFTNAERKALLDSAQVAGFNVLRLMNESAATALAYGIYKQDLPAAEERPRNVVFLDWGHASLQVFACAFNKGKLKMLSCTADPQLGGRDVDLILAEHFCKEFQQRYCLDPRSNLRAFLRLLQEVEKLKKQMSANSTKMPMNIECFMDDRDVYGDMKRVDMEQMCAHLFQRAEKTLRQCLEDSKLRIDDIYAVEIVGGSTRIPAIKGLIETVFGKPASTTLNQDEAVSRGCALQCAMLSPAIRVRDFSVTDCQNYPIKLVWDASMGDDGEMEVFPQNHPVPFSKLLTFYRKEPFSIKAFYVGNIPYPDPFIGQYIIKDIKPTPEGESAKVKVKVRVNLHGIFSVSSAALVEKLTAAEQEAAEEAAMDTSDNNADSAASGQQQNHVGNGSEVRLGKRKGDNNCSDQSLQRKLLAWFYSEDSKSGSATVKQEKEADGKKKKQMVKNVELPIEYLMHGYNQSEINTYTELELKMIANDRQENERVDARNALEEYVYELRGKLGSEEELSQFVTENDRNTLCDELENLEDWLYTEEGEGCNRQLYVDKLASLKGVGEPIKVRRLEYELRPTMLDDLGGSLQLARKAVDQWRTGDERFSHLTEAELMKVQQAIDSSNKWLEERRTTLNATPKTQTPSTTVAQINQERQNFESTVNPILSKPKPKAETPAPPNSDSTDGANSKEGQGDNSKENVTGSEDKMDAE
uniref:Heat shock 70 kDa protein 4L n=2 Tax=Timema TaxID=61471 RepID=A0A7R9AZI4_TIMSH|nr:unnamed protein product [Timema shepardi]CAD7569601.1 unnamed protein product [Timema californicum]